MHGRGVHDREDCNAGVGGMCGRAACMTGVHTWQRCVHSRGHVSHERWPLQQAVRILLECIFVASFFELSY